VGHRLGSADGVAGSVGSGRGLVVPTTVEDEVFGRRDEARGEGRAWPVGSAEADVERGSATGGPPAGGVPVSEPPVSAMAMPPTAATSSTPAVTIKRMPRRNRISSRRA
jgi:hypothetical protein